MDIRKTVALNTSDILSFYIRINYGNVNFIVRTADLGFYRITMFSQEIHDHFTEIVLHGCPDGNFYYICSLL